MDDDENNVIDLRPPSREDPNKLDFKPPTTKKHPKTPRPHIVAKNAVLRKIRENVTGVIDEDGNYTPDYQRIEQLAGKGLRNEQIAAIVGLTNKEFKTLFEIDEQVELCINRGRGIQSEIVSDSLFNEAKNGNVIAQIFWLKEVAGWQPPPQKLQIEQNVNVKQQVQFYLPKVMPADAWQEYVNTDKERSRIEAEKLLIELEKEPAEITDAEEVTDGG